MSFDTVQFHADFLATVPEVTLACGAMALLLVGAFTSDKWSGVITWGCVALFAVVAATASQGEGHVLAYGGTVIIDPFARFAKILVLSGSAITMLMSIDYLRDEKLTRFEYPLLMALATLGMMMMISANDLIVLYVGLELQSLALYVLAAFARDNIRSSEAGLKYFVLGALSSGTLLYGASLIYGFTGTTNFGGIAAVISNAAGLSIGLKVGLAMVLAGLAFKVSAVPFHMWTPDVYEGSPTPVTAFFAAAPKIAAMVLISRVVFGPFGHAQGEWVQILAPISVASMIWGALAAIGQSNIKRLMAYSSISHMGYALIGFVAGTQAGVEGVLIYLVIYLAMTVGTFIVIMMMRRNGLAVEDVSDLAGLSQRDPTSAYLLAIMMFSLIGIPPLAGFWGKWFVFLAVIDAAKTHQWMYFVAVVGFVTSVVGAYYYLRIVKIMFFDQPAAPFDKPLGTVNAGLLALSSAVVIFFVVLPAPLVDAASAAAKSLFP